MFNDYKQQLNSSMNNNNRISSSNSINSPSFAYQFPNSTSNQDISINTTQPIIMPSGVMNQPPPTLPQQQPTNTNTNNSNLARK
jgi:hypothetical protein